MKIALFLSLIFFQTTVFSSEKISCQAKYDEFGIPHQKVKNEKEFYFCFGYHHGSDRAWQMDYFRRVASGRNAEIYGLIHLKNDLMMKLLNLPKEANKIWQSFSNEEKDKIQSYVDGVNEGFKIGKENQEFKDLGYAPEKWEATDTMLVLLLQSFDQTRRTFFRDFQETIMAQNWGSKAPELFSDENVPWNNSILKDGEYPRRTTAQLDKKKNQIQIATLWSPFPTLFGEESGSNNWVISKENSKTGNAFLANDPHLDLKTPMFWYWIHLKSQESEVIGGSLPGVPVVVSGTNGKVSWGLTNSYLKSAEAVYLEETDSDEMTSFWPLVWVKLGFLKLPFFFKRFELLNGEHRILPLETDSSDKIVLRWSGFHLKASDISPMFHFYKSKTVEEIDSYLKDVGVPSWNFVFADLTGDIGYRVIGNAYKIIGKKPWGIEKKKSHEISKSEYLSPDERPHLLKPKRGYIYTANNRHWPEDSLHFGGRGYTQSFRGFRIDENLKVKQDFDSIKNIQCDDQVVDARFLLPALMKHVEIKELKNWNYLSDISSTETSLYRRMIDLILDSWKVDEYALYRLLSTELEVEKKAELKEIYLNAIQDYSQKKWRDFHVVNFPHMSQTDYFKFSPEIPGIGDTHSVNPGTSKWNEQRKIYEQTAGASMRLIVEMKAPRPKIYLALPGRNRDYASSRNDNPWEDWSRCNYREVEY